MTPDSVNSLVALIIQYYFAVAIPLGGIYVSVLLFRRVSGV